MKLAEVSSFRGDFIGARIDLLVKKIVPAAKKLIGRLQAEEKIKSKVYDAIFKIILRHSERISNKG